MKRRLLGLALLVALGGCGDATDGNTDALADASTVDVQDAVSADSLDAEVALPDADAVEADTLSDVADDTVSDIADTQSEVGDAQAEVGDAQAEVGDAQAEVGDAQAEVAEVSLSDTDADDDSQVGTDAQGTDGGPDAGDIQADMDTAADAETDGASSCLLAGYAAGERYSLDDNCNFCDCLADGSSVCTSRTCASSTPTCTYDGVEHPYAVLFSATDGCNDCVCAASGLACTHRCPELPQEGAILMADMDEHCGDDTAFTGNAVLSGLPDDDITVPFSYNQTGTLYPETLPDTELRVRVVYDGGFVVCRLPSPTQPAIDMEVTIEWITQDGAFDEGLHTYLRRNNFGFVDAWTFAAGGPVDSLDGTYDPECLDPTGFGFTANWHADGTLEGSVSKSCEIDIGLQIGSYLEVP